MKKKAMISQPMGGLTEEQIVETRDRVIKALEAMGYNVRSSTTYRKHSFCSFILR